MVLNGKSIKIGREIIQGCKKKKKKKVAVEQGGKEGINYANNTKDFTT